MPKDENITGTRVKAVLNSMYSIGSFSQPVLLALGPSPLLHFMQLLRSSDTYWVSSHFTQTQQQSSPCFTSPKPHSSLQIDL